MPQYKKIYLEKIQYADIKPYCYYTAAREIENANVAGEIPLISVTEPTNDQPIVAITLGRQQHPDRNEPDYCTNHFIADALLQLGITPVFISFQNVQQQLDYWKPSGIILPGGSFYVPHEWLLAPTTEYQWRDLTRFNANIDLLKYAEEKNLPILGICAGMQLIAGRHGAKSELISRYCPQSQILHKTTTPDTENFHKVKIAPNTKLAEITGTDEYEAISIHQSTIDIGKANKLIVSARAPDGIIEAIELSDNPYNRFVLGIQWHAEYNALDQTHPDHKIFQAFAVAAKN